MSRHARMDISGLCPIYFGTLNDDMEEGDRHTKGLLEQSDQDLTNIFQYHYHNLNQPILKI
ncbi:7632_t:CDS:2 [Entrophospora sp. SA101]|nr:7632_t:CDS:2 [Entrophospora sp. SA101]